mmetsp:Transcript_36957/g.105826  ORF Transcript_36957/g.105826 Transcript_36957/m.105826 type:complete len:273 (-) Transcript_36957:568-1386(-)
MCVCVCQRAGDLSGVNKLTGGGPGGYRGPWRGSIAELEEANQAASAALNDKGVDHQIILKIHDITANNRPPYYLACPECKRKVEPQDENKFSCNQCQKTIEHKNPRYILPLHLMDHSKMAIYATAFDETAKVILGIDAAALEPLYEAGQNEGDPTYEGYITEATHKSYHMSIRSKMETYNDQTRVKHTVTYLEEWTQEKRAREGNSLLDLLEEELNDPNIANQLYYNTGQEGGAPDPAAAAAAAANDMDDGGVDQGEVQWDQYGEGEGDMAD